MNSLFNLNLPPQSARRDQDQAQFFLTKTYEHFSHRVHNVRTPSFHVLVLGIGAAAAAAAVEVHRYVLQRHACNLRLWQADQGALYIKHNM